MSSNATSSKISLYGGIATNVGIALSKFAAAYFTGSSAMLSEGIHSLVDTGNGGLLLYGTAQSQKAPDAKYPFGRSKELYFWSLIVAVLVFSIGGGMSFYEGVQHLQHPGPMEDPRWNYIVLGVSVVLEAVAAYLSIKAFRETHPGSFFRALRTSKDPSAFAQVLENSAALVGLLLAGAGVFFGHLLNNPYLDGAASIAIGLLLMGVAVFLIYKTKALLVGQGLDEDALAGLARLTAAQPTVLRSRPPLSMYLGPNDVMLALDVEFRDELTANEVEQAVDALQHAIRAEYPLIKRIFIEAKSLAGKHLETQPPVA